MTKPSPSQRTFLIRPDSRLANMLYKPEAKALTDQVWKETLDEFSFADAREVLQSLGMQV